MINKLSSKLMLLADLFITPAMSPIKFSNYGLTIFDTYLVYPIFIAVKRKQA
ncbi:MAG: Uncharacterised protein [Halieaceae bacterium]|nr:MAG: Uncharacterised protein [Halieaceae bacterium]